VAVSPVGGDGYAGESAAPEPVRAEPSGQPARCFTFGPLKSRAVASRLLTVLRNRAVDAALREERITEAEQYWVYFPPLESREAAHRMARALRDKGFTDYYVVGQGELENAIALGLFNHTRGARRRVEELRALGFEAKIAPRGLAESARYWIDYRLFPDSALRPGHLEALLGNGTNAKVAPRDCSDPQRQAR
jgi:hypothetical protein